MGQLFRRVLTKTGQAVMLVVTKVGQAVIWVIAETSQGLRWVVTKVGQTVSWVKPSDPSRATDVITGGDVARKLQSQESLVSSDTRNYCIDIPVDNDDEHRVAGLREPLLSGDEAKAAEVICDYPTPPVAVPDVPTKHQLEAAMRSPEVEGEAKTADVVCDYWMPPVAVPEVPTKHQLEAAIGSPVVEGEARAADVVCDYWTPPVAVPEVPTKHQLEPKFTDVATMSSMAVSEEPPNSSNKQVVEQVSPVMVGSLSTLSEPKQQKRGRLGRYDRGQLILLVGEGDFSFSACLAAAFGDASNMVATSLDTFDFLKKNYKRAPENIKELKRRGCEVIHGVDATKMANHPKLCSIKFDRIIYNFPYWGLSDVQISFHQSLVLGFIENAMEMIGDDGEIHVTHRTSRFSNEWNIVDLESSAGLELIRAVKLKLRNYPAYYSKYGFGGDTDFDCHPSKTKKIKLAHKKKSQRKHKN